jgi:ribosomal protein S28E/S33
MFYKTKLIWLGMFFLGFFQSAFTNADDFGMDSIEAIPYNNTSSVKFALYTNTNRVVIGQTIVVKFKSDRDGYVSLWNIGSGGEVTRLFGEMRVSAQTLYELPPLPTVGPTGRDYFYLLWTVAPSIQPQSVGYSNVYDFAKAIKHDIQQRVYQDQWGIAKTYFDTVSGQDMVQHNNKDIGVIPFNNTRDVELNIEINKPTVAIGQDVSFRFRSNKAGYVSLWDVGTSNTVTRLYPASGDDLFIESNSWYGAGGKDSAYVFTIREPTGMEDVYLLWTAKPEAQPKELKYSNAHSFGKSIHNTVQLRIPQNQWETAKVTFEVIDPNYIPQPVLPVSGSNANVYVLAMGANVDQLTKTNNDAIQFAYTIQKVFHVSSENVKVIKNAKKRDFENGMKWLRSTVDFNDSVFVFFSGHGTTITDQNGDEADGLDEAFVMYDAQDSRFSSENYLVLDEQYAEWVNALKTDKVFTVIDSCHSGGLNKGHDITVTNARVKFFSGGNTKRFIPKGVGGTISLSDIRGIPNSQNDLIGTQKPSDSVGGLDNHTKGLVLAAAREDQKALELATGGLFVMNFVQQISQAHRSDLFSIFNVTSKIVTNKSKGKQTPTLMGNIDLARELKIN